jgi:hypothetical protein
MPRLKAFGENCEIKAVQRRCGAEPMLPFRFSSAPLPKLLMASRALFAGVVPPKISTSSYRSNGCEYVVLDGEFGFYHDAWIHVGHMNPENDFCARVARVPALVQKLIEDLTKGRSLFSSMS